MIGEREVKGEKGGRGRRGERERGVFVECLFCGGERSREI